MFESMAERLKMDISKEIAYAYTVFVPDGTKRVISKMKRNIHLNDRKFLAQELQIAVGSGLIFPYDVLNSKLEKHISDFYAEFSLSQNALKKLLSYGERGEKFKTEFDERLEQSRETAIRAVRHEMNLQMMQSKDAKSVVDHIQKILTKRFSSLKQLLKESAGQMQQYMVLWDYQDKGYTHYRVRTNGDNCEDCTNLDGTVFPIYEAKSGKSLAPLHPNCDCAAEVLDKNGNTVFVVKRENENKSDTDSLDYLQTSLKQVILGNYTDHANLLGTLGQILVGLIGLDLPADIRDIIYDITKFEMAPEHAFQTLFDALALLPIAGGIKYIDEAGDALKSAAKYGNDAAELIKNSETSYKMVKRPKPMTAKEALEAAKALGFEATGQFSHGQPVFKKSNKYITPDIDSHIGGVWKMADSIKNLKSKKTRLGTYDEKLKRIGD